MHVTGELQIAVDTQEALDNALAQVNVSPDYTLVGRDGMTLTVAVDATAADPPPLPEE